MKPSSNSTLLLGSVMGVILLAVITWFLGVGPRLGAAGDAKDHLVAQNEENAGLKDNVAKLKAEAIAVPALQEEIADIRVALPPVENTADGRRVMNAAVAASGVTFVQDSVADPVVAVNSLAMAEAAAAVGLESTIDGVVLDGLVVTPVSIEVVGTYEQALAFVRFMQNDDHRYFLVSGLKIQAITGPGIILDRRMNPGDVDVAVQGFFFTLGYGTAAPPDQTLPDLITPEPPPNARNPFYPFVPSS